MRFTSSKCFSAAHRAGADFLLGVQANHKTLYRQIADQLLGKCMIHFMATDHEIGHGCDIPWSLRAQEVPVNIQAKWHGTILIAEVTATGIRDIKPFKAMHRFITGLRTTPEACASS